jgi:Spy/CpxP family protein refolding chaperone
MQRSKQVALAFLLGALLTGAVMGFAAARAIDAPVAGARPAPSFRDSVAKVLELSPAQRDSLDRILDQRNEHMRQAMAPVKPQLDSIKNVSRDQIRQMLTPAQRETFEALLAQQERERAPKPPSTGHQP